MLSYLMKWFITGPWLFASDQVSASDLTAACKKNSHIMFVLMIDTSAKLCRRPGNNHQVVDLTCTFVNSGWQFYLRALLFLLYTSLTLDISSWVSQRQLFIVEECLHLVLVRWSCMLHLQNCITWLRLGTSSSFFRLLCSIYYEAWSVLATSCSVLYCCILVQAPDCMSYLAKQRHLTHV